MAVIYADEILVLNLAADYVLLLMTAKVAGFPARRLRLLAAAFLGALYALVAAMFPPLSGWPGKGICCVLMALTAFGRGRKLLRLTLVFIGLSAAFAGGVTALAGRGRVKLWVTASAFLLGAVFYPAAFRRIGTHRVVGQVETVRVELGGKSASFQALVDTGNTLRDPVTGEPVTVCVPEALRPLFRTGEAELLANGDPTEAAKVLGDRFRLVPYRSLGGGGVLAAFRPDRLVIGGKVQKSGLVAIAREGISEGKGYAALTYAG